MSNPGRSFGRAIMLKSRCVLIFLIAALARVEPAPALETDQFTVPPQPLVDLGPEFNHQTAAGIKEAIDFANTRHQQLMASAAKATSQRSRARYIEQANQCLSDQYIA